MASIPSAPPSAGGAPTMKINVKTLTSESFMLDLDPSETVYDLKVRVMSLHSENIEPARQKLLFRGKILTDDSALATSYGLENGVSIHLVIAKTQQTNSDIPETFQRGSYDAGTTEDQRLLQNGQGYPNNNQYIQQQNNDVNRIVIAAANMPGYEELSQSIKLIQMFSIIDVLLLILFCLWGAFVFLVVLPLAACGYYGAKKLNRWALAGYGLFIILSITFRILLCVIYPSVLMIILTVVSVLLEMYVLRKLIILWRVIPYLDQGTADLLRQFASIDNAF